MKQNEHFFVFESDKFNNFQTKFPQSRKGQISHRAAAEFWFESSRFSRHLVYMKRISGQFIQQLLQTSYNYKGGIEILYFEARTRIPTTEWEEQ